MDGRKSEDEVTYVGRRTDLGGQLDRNGQALLVFDPKGTDDHFCEGL